MDAVNSQHKLSLLNSVHWWVGDKYDLTRWVQNVTEETEAKYLAVLFQFASEDTREPTELIISNDDGTLEIAKCEIQTTKVNVLRYAHVDCELSPGTPHRLEISLEEKN